MCASVDAQKVGLQHILMVDLVPADIRPEQWQLLYKVGRPGRQIHLCGTHHHNFGNTCRFNAWEKAHGDYLLYLDDDDYYVDGALDRLDAAIPDGAVWGSYPIEFCGGRHYKLPAQTGNVFGAQLFHQRLYDGWQIRYPNVAIYSADGLLADGLNDLGAPHTALPWLDPVVIMPQSSKGQL